MEKEILKFKLTRPVILTNSSARESRMDSSDALAVRNKEKQIVNENCVDEKLYYKIV